MLKAEIKTDHGLYIVGLEGAATLREGWELVKRNINDGEPFEGDSLLYIGKEPEIHHIKVYGEVDDVPAAVEPPSDDETARHEDLQEGPYTFKDKVEHLGVKLNIEYLEYYTKGHSYFIITSINNDDPFNALGTNNQGQVMTKIIENRGLTPAEYTLVIPPATLNEKDEYTAFIEDYVAAVKREQEHESKDKTARAWQGWTDENK